MFERVSYIVYYTDDIYKRLSKENINIVYQSKKNNYLVFYVDKKEEKNILETLKKITQVSEVVKSKFDADYLEFNKQEDK